MARPEAVRHLLLDADGVLQQPRGGWRSHAVRVLGEHTDDFHAALAAVEAPSLSGRGDFDVALAGLLAELGVETPPDEVYQSLWLELEVVADTVSLVHAARAAGLGVHLGTNQHARRAAYMKDVLRYGELFDSSFYSCELGVAKPEPGFFTRVADTLGVPADQVVFVDDALVNVTGAREAGMRAERWTVADGPAAIRSLLAAHGATLPG